MDIPLRALTAPPGNHFYGYFNMSPWNRSMTHHLALETTFHDRRPAATDSAVVGLVAMESGEFTPYARTAAFNFQQGSMLRWIDVGQGEEFTYNDWDDGTLVARATEPIARRTRTLGGAIEAISPTAPLAISLNYARIARCRPVVGYATADTERAEEPYPADDGLFALDLRTGERRLLLSIAEVIRALPADETRVGPAYFHHIFFNPNGSRLVFFCRIVRPEGWYTSLWSLKPDGSDLACLIDYRATISHLDWWDDRRLVVSTDLLDGRMQFVTFTVGADDFRPFGGGQLPRDGHLCFAPDRRWAVYDIQPRGAVRLNELYLFHPESGKRFALGQFYAAPEYTGDIRCDLHPRWSPDGTLVSFDSVHTGSRQIHIADVSAIVHGDR